MWQLITETEEGQCFLCRDTEKRRAGVGQPRCSLQAHPHCK